MGPAAGLNVGVRGAATLNITAGSAVSNTSSTIGSNSNGMGTVTVNGNSSTWTNSSSLIVGDSGRGTLNVQDGGRVSNASAFIARLSGSTGNATVSGAGANWSIGQRLSVGGDAATGISGGTGTLQVQPGGSVDVAQDIVLFPNGQVRLEGGTLTAQSIGFQGGGQFQWNSGTLHVEIYNGNLTNAAGTLAPGRSPGSTTIIGNYTQQPGAELEIEIGGTLVAAEHDFVNVTGTATVGGQLNLALIHGFVPSAADTFTILTAGSLLSFFSNVTNGQRLDTVDGLGSFLVHYGPTSMFNPNHVRLTNFELNFLAGDYNHDGIVDAADYVVWRKTDSGNSQGYIDWRENFGEGMGDGGGSAGSLPSQTGVPEPATLVMLMFAAAGWCLRRGRAG